MSKYYKYEKDDHNHYYKYKKKDDKFADGHKHEKKDDHHHDHKYKKDYYYFDFHKHKKDKVVAEDDYYKVKEGHKLKGNVLDNDYDTKGHDLDVVWYSQPKHGKLWLDEETGEFKYFAYKDKDKHDEKDYFIYKAADKYGNYDVAKVYIDIKDYGHKGYNHSHDYYMT